MAYTLRFFATLAAITFALATNAQLIDKKSLTLEAAQKIAAASLAEARANNLNLVIAIVDDGGHLITLSRMETAQYGSGRAQAELVAVLGTNGHRPQQLTSNDFFLFS